MAVEKKSSKKGGGKKSSTKVKAVMDPNCTQDPANIIVPKGGQVIQFYDLVPKFPVMKKGKLHAQSWDLIPKGSDTPIGETLNVGFHRNLDKLERRFERAILVVKMKQQPESGGTWRFALGGVATDLADSDPDNDIVVQIIDNGLTMLVFVHVLPEESDENIGFRFVASFANAVSGEVSIYESKDPGIQPHRPVGP